MNKFLANVLSAAAVASISLGACAQTSDNASKPGSTTTTTTVTTTEEVIVPADSPTLTTAESKDLKNQSTAEYKARKKIADANLDLAKADCKSSGGTWSVEHACKQAAKAQDNKDKADAKLLHKQEKSDINDNTQ